MGDGQKKAVIVGATSGIGLELVKVLTAKGWQVGIAGRRQERLQQIQSQNLDVVATECIDITKEDAPRRLLTLIGKMGGMDLYFHSAGIGYQNPTLDIDKEMATVATNVVGFTQMVDTAFHYFEAHPDRPGHLAVISSIAGTKGLGAAPSYSSTKRYINHYMECLTQLCHIKGIQHIHLHDIRPGFVRTPLLADGHHYPCQLDPHKVALSIERGIRNNRSVITIDWLYSLLVFIWRLIPRWLWVRMPVASRDMKMNKTLLLFMWVCLCCLTAGAQVSVNVPELPQRSEPTWGDWQSWGAQEDGIYWNPVIPADYSDLDCIRVGDDYYAISSTMQFAPGMTVLHSKDLVNWEIAGHAVEDVSQISKGMTWEEMDRYGRGVWAGTIRYHQGRFYVFFGTPDEGYFMTSAEKVEGPWEPLTVLLAELGWDDCTALWDEKGKGWFVGTCFREGYKTYRFPMAEDGKSIDRERATLINEGNGREANKLLWHDGYYYLIFSEHKNGVGRYVMAKRGRRIDGKFLEEKQLFLPCVKEHEPNQGGIVEGKDGRWYFLTHHGSGDWSGRIVSLLPVEWVDGWPMMGDRSDSELGKMVWSGTLPPLTSHLPPLTSLQRSDDFDSERLGAQWQWNYQPRKEMFSLTERKGWLRLKASVPLEKGRLLKACNTLTQRSFRTRRNEVVVKMDISQATEGMRAGLCHFAEQSASLGIVCEEGKCYVEYRKNDHAERGAEVTGQYVWLKSTWGLDGKSQFSYSADGDRYLPMGTYQLSWGFYRGDRIGVFCFNDLAESGWVDVDYLHYQMEK